MKSNIIPDADASETPACQQSPAPAGSASFEKRLTAAIARRQKEIGAAAEEVREIYRTPDHPDLDKWIMEAVNQLTAGLGLCYLAGLTMEQMLEPWLQQMEKLNPDLGQNSKLFQPPSVDNTPSP